MGLLCANVGSKWCANDENVYIDLIIIVIKFVYVRLRQEEMENEQKLIKTWSATGECIC